MCDAHTMYLVPCYQRLSVGQASCNVRCEIRVCTWTEEGLSLKAYQRLSVLSDARVYQICKRLFVCFPVRVCFYACACVCVCVCFRQGVVCEQHKLTRTGHTLDERVRGTQWPHRAGRVHSGDYVEEIAKEKLGPHLPSTN